MGLKRVLKIDFEVGAFLHVLSVFDEHPGGCRGRSEMGSSFDKYAAILSTHLFSNKLLLALAIIT